MRILWEETRRSLSLKYTEESSIPVATPPDMPEYECCLHKVRQAHALSACRIRSNDYTCIRDRCPKLQITGKMKFLTVLISRDNHLSRTRTFSDAEYTPGADELTLWCP